MPEKDSSHRHPLDVGTVAEEAERLVAAMRARSEAAAATQPDDERPADKDRPADGGEHSEDRRGQCERAACGVCPVCRGAAFLDAIPAETLESVADLVGMAAVALRKFAASARDAQSPAQADDEER